jgi:hypothetical protein
MYRENLATLVCCRPNIFRSLVARWFDFKPKIPIWVNFGGFCNGSYWYVLLPFGLFYAHLVYFMVIWYISPHFGMLHREKSGNPVFDSLLRTFGLTPALNRSSK